MNIKQIFFTFVLLSLLALSSTSDAAAEEGALAPDFSISRLDGSQFKLSEFRGKKAVYMVFWTTWCTYCMEKIPFLQNTQQIYGKQLEIIAIDTSVKDSLTKAYLFQKNRNIQYPLAFDHGKKVTDLYGVWGTPTEFIIDINGKIIHRDQVPKNISENLSNWNMISHFSHDKQLIADNQCNPETKTC